MVSLKPGAEGAGGERSEQRRTDRHEHDSLRHLRGSDAECHDRREERGAQQRALHGHVRHRIGLIQLAVGLAAGGIEGGLLDEPGLLEGRQGSPDRLSSHPVGRSRDADPLGGQLGPDDGPRD
jgi:hypothetical protein